MNTYIALAAGASFGLLVGQVLCRWLIADDPHELDLLCYSLDRDLQVFHKYVEGTRGGVASDRLVVRGGVHVRPFAGVSGEGVEPEAEGA